MVFEVTLANAITVTALFCMAIWALLKALTHQGERRLQERFDALQRTLSEMAAQQQKNSKEVLELEREFRRHQAEAERNFVRRDDFVRHVGALETRIDNFALRVERALAQKQADA